MPASVDIPILWNEYVDIYIYHFHRLCHSVETVYVDADIS